MKGYEVSVYNHRMLTLKRVLLFLIACLLLTSVSAQSALKDTLSAARSGKPVSSKVQKFQGIPYNITNAKTQITDGPVAMILSGDGGWFSFEQAIANNLGTFGVPTIGIDTRKYFWNRKTPEKTASDMAELLNYYGREWGKKKFVLIGYSYGAELVPFIITLLPQQIKSGVMSAVLLSPAETTDFEVHISNMLDLGNRQNTYNVIEEIKKLEKINTICIFGQNEKSPMPGLLKSSSAKFVFIPGDHHYHGNATLIVKVMKDNYAF
jgi:type IV secretory pathway VirJ component